MLKIFWFVSLIQSMIDFNKDKNIKKKSTISIKKRLESFKWFVIYVVFWIIMMIIISFVFNWSVKNFEIRLG